MISFDYSAADSTENDSKCCEFHPGQTDYASNCYQPNLSERMAKGLSLFSIVVNHRRKAPVVEFGIHSRLRACALIGMLVRVQSGASSDIFPWIPLPHKPTEAISLRNIVLPKHLLIDVIGSFSNRLPREIFDSG